MKEKVNEKLDKIGFIGINIIIVIVSLYIGSSLKEPLYGIQAIITILASIYIIAKKIIGQKQIIIKGKIDILVLLFITSTFFPIIFKTYASLNDSYSYILKYISIYSIYIIARNVLNKKRIEIIISTIIISSILPILFGIDKLTINFFEGFLSKINSVKITSDRMVSTFGYANTLALYLSITMFMGIEKYKKENKKKKKILLIIYILVCIICILLTQSKSIVFLLTCIFFIKIIKISIKKKNTLKVALIGICMLIVLGTYFIIAIQISKDLVITEKEKTCVIKNIEKDKDYSFTFEIYANSQKEYNTFEIEIVEINRYLQDTILKKISFSSFSGEKTIRFKTSKVASYIEIRIKNKLQEELAISKFFINNKEYILEYKYIKEEIVRLITNFNIKNPSVWQRGDFIKDGIKIIKDNWLIGAGGNAWENLYQQYQEYLYGAKEVHSYPMEIWMSFGLLGIVSYLGIIIDSMRQINNRKIYQGTSIGFILIIIHSLMDFDLSFFIMQILFFIIIATIYEKEKREITKKSNIPIEIIEILIIIAIGSISIENAKMFYQKNVIKDNTYQKQMEVSRIDEEVLYNRIQYLIKEESESKQIIPYIKQYMRQEPYKYQNVMYEDILEMILKDIKKENLQERIKDIENVEKILKNRKRSCTYDIVQIKERANIMVDFAKGIKKKAEELESDELKEISKRFFKMVVNEYDDNVKIMSDYQRHGEYESVVEMKLESYELLYREVEEELR